MPIDHNKKCIFIHIPKNAGSTVEVVFNLWNEGNSSNRSIRGKNMVGPISIVDKLKYGLHNETDWQHITALEIKKVIGDSLYHKYFKFAIVRNPWDRMISWYHYLDVRIEFAKWIMQPTVNNNFTSLERMLRQQVDYITDKSGKIIVDKILRFEEFENDFKQLCKTLGIEIEPLPCVRKSNRRPCREYYTTAESISTVKNMFSKDIELFKYKFEDCERL